MDNLFVAYALIALGLLLLAGELLLPTGGILFVIGLAALITGVASTFYRGPAQGVVALVIIFLAITIVGPLLIYYWPRTALGKKMTLPAGGDDGSVAEMPVNLELEQLRGRYGKTISALRPAGVVDFHGKRVDTISEGELIDAGEWVRCMEVKVGRVVVRRVERPPELGDINPDDLR